jgi:hypothetical protein
VAKEYTWGMAAQDAVSGFAAGLMAEARRTGSGAGFAAGFAGAAAPTIMARNERIAQDIEDYQQKRGITRERILAEADKDDFATFDLPESEGLNFTFDMGSWFKNTLEFYGRSPQQVTQYQSPASMQYSPQATAMASQQFSGLQT